MNRTHPKTRATAAKLLSKLESQCSLRFPGNPSEYSFERILPGTEEHEKTGWRWQVSRRPYGIKIGSKRLVPEVLRASRLLCVPEDDTIDVICVSFGRTG